jgi:hypothetical protein
MSFLDHLVACNRHDPTRYRPLWVGGRRIGAVRLDRVPALEALPGCFVVEPAAIRLRVAGEGPDSCAAAFDAAVAALADAGHLHPPGTERYPVAERVGAPPLGSLPRNAAQFFGVPSAGVHLNGYVPGPCGNAAEGMEVWVAIRSGGWTNYPGELDQMVAGGQPVGLGIRENLEKECAEEADIPAELAARARPAGAVTYRLDAPEGLRDDTLYVYDLALPADFVPRNTDGEVARFERWPVARLAATVRDGFAFKFNCSLVVIDFLIRHGLLAPEEPDYLALVSGLRGGLPR